MIKISNQIGLISLPSLIKIVPLITPFGKKNSHPLCHLSSQASPRLEKNHVEKFNKINKTLIFYKLNIILTIKKRGSQNQWGYGAIECAISISGWTQLEWFQLISLVFYFQKNVIKMIIKKSVVTNLIYRILCSRRGSSQWLLLRMIRTGRPQSTIITTRGSSGSMTATRTTTTRTTITESVVSGDETPLLFWSHF